MNDELKYTIQFEMKAETLAGIDNLIENEEYQDLSTFLNKAISAELQLHQDAIDRIELKKVYVFGLLVITAKSLREKYLEQNKMMDIKVIGALKFQDDVTPELFTKTIHTIRLGGILRGPEEVVRLAREMRYSILGSTDEEYVELEK